MKTTKPFFFTDTNGKVVSLIRALTTIGGGGKLKIGEIEVRCLKKGNEHLELKVGDCLFMKDIQENRDLMGDDYHADIKEILDEGDSLKITANLNFN